MLASRSNSVVCDTIDSVIGNIDVSVTVRVEDVCRIAGGPGVSAVVDDSVAVVETTAISVIVTCPETSVVAVFVVSMVVNETMVLSPASVDKLVVNMSAENDICNYSTFYKQGDKHSPHLHTNMIVLDLTRAPTSTCRFKQ